MFQKQLSFLFCLACFFSACTQNDKEICPSDSISLDSLATLQSQTERLLQQGNLAGLQEQASWKLCETYMQAFGRETWAVSPLSMQINLAMLNQGAQGLSSQELNAFLGASAQEQGDLYQSLQNFVQGRSSAYPSHQLHIANSLWLGEDFAKQVKEEFRKALETKFQALVGFVDFEALSDENPIDAWAKKHSAGLIKKIAPKSGGIVALLANIVYFKDLWLLPFNKKLTNNAPFYSANKGEQEVPMMSMDAAESFLYGELQGKAQIIRLPYKAAEGKALAMYFCLPMDTSEEGNATRPSLAEVFDMLRQNSWEDIQASMKQERVYVQIPRFELKMKKTFTGSSEENNPLVNMGIASIFSPQQANLQGIASRLYIDKIVHELVLVVDEAGTELAAATTSEVKQTSAQLSKFFTADRPFLFFLLDEQTKSLLLAGQLLDF